MHRITIFSLLISLSWISQATPIIANVTGTLADSETVTLAGSGFGALGPTIHVYDNFDAGGSVDAEVDDSAVIGSWIGNGTNDPTYDSVSYSGNFSMRINKGLQTNGFSHKKASFPPATEVFISYWLQVPAGTTFPGSNVPGVLPTVETITESVATWKPMWMTDGEDVVNDNDVVIPNYAGPDMYIFGNNTLPIPGSANRVRLTPVGTPDQSNSIFRFGQWVRITAWLKGGDDPDPAHVNTPLPGPPPTGPGQTKWSYDIPTADISKPPLGGTPTGLPRVIQNNTQPVFTYNHPATVDAIDSPLGIPRPPYQWTHIQVGGWAGNGVADWSLTRPVIDDFYMATGAGAQARVEICESPTYGDCERFGYITVTSPANWTDTAITGEIRKGALLDAEVERAFAYVYDENGLVNAAGFPLCPNCPQPPINLQAN